MPKTINKQTAVKMMIGVSPPGSKATIVWIYLAGEIHGHSGAQMPSPWVNTLARQKNLGISGMSANSNT